jgi:16S rRNA processing protein RimM
MTGKSILVGQFGAAHGIKGELRLKSYTGAPEAIAAYGPLSDRAGARQFLIETLRPIRDDLFVVKIAGIDDRTAAEALTNVELYVPHDCLPPVAAEEYYHADLIGLAALDETGAQFGRVAAVLDFGGGDLLEIAVPRGEPLLVPFSKSFVPSVDLESGTITITRPVEIEGEPAPGQSAASNHVPAERKRRGPHDG